MKTQKEIEDIKNKLAEEISELSSLISMCRDVSDIMHMGERSRQKQAIHQ